MLQFFEVSRCDNPGNSLVIVIVGVCNRNYQDEQISMLLLLIKLLPTIESTGKKEARN